MADLTSQIVMKADASGVETGVGRAKRSLADLAAAGAASGKQAADGLGKIGGGASNANRELSNLINRIQRTSAAVEAGSRTNSDYFRVLAQQRGIGADAIAPYLATLDAAHIKAKAANDVIDGSSKTLEKVGISAKQTAAALRGVPAQFTDIAVGLAGGQNPLTVLLQQGGQLKDMFGGIGPAAKALGGYVLGLINPFTIAAAASSALVVGFYQGRKESEAYQKALLLTGSSIGLVSGQLSDMASRLGQNTGSQAKAAETLAALANTGKVAGAQIEGIAKAAIGLEVATGRAIDKTIDDFVKLADEPTKASAKLNESMHHLSLATYERIAELERQGDKEAAAAAAQQAFAEAVQSRTKEITENLGYIERAYDGIARAIKGVVNGALDVGRVPGPEQDIARIDGIIEAVSAGRLRMSKDRLQALKDERSALLADAQLVASAAASDAQRVAINDKAVSAYSEILRLRDSELPKEQRMQEEIKKRIALYDDIRAKDPNDPILAKEAGDIANIRAKYKPDAPKPIVDNAAARMLQSLREQEAADKSQLAQELKLTAAERARAKFVQEIADLKDKRVLTADQKSLLASKEMILAQLDQNVAISKQVELQQQAAEALKRFKATTESLNVSIDASVQGRRDMYSRALSGVGMGDQARQELLERESIYKEFQARQTKLAKDAKATGQLGSKDYEDETKRIADSLNESLMDSAAYWAKLKANQADGTLGMHAAFEDYLDSASNTMKQTQDLTSGMLNGVEDAFVKFATTGKLSMTSLANTFIAEITRMEIRAAAAKFLKSGAGGDLIGGIIKFFGGGNSAYTSVANALPGDSLDNLLNLSRNFGGKAEGGSVAAGGAYIVGERGPEILRMGSQSGSITPNDKIGGGVQIVNNVAAGVSRNEMLQALNLSQKATEASILNTLRKQKVLA